MFQNKFIRQYWISVDLVKGFLAFKHHANSNIVAPPVFSFLFFGVIVLRNGAERKKYFSFFLYPSFHISIRDKVDWLCRFFLNSCLALSRFPMLRKSGLLESWSVLWTATNGVLSVNLTCSCACGTCDFFTSSRKFLLDAKKTFDTPEKQVQTFPELHLVESVQW